jgi:hypothetical protein
MVTTIKPKRERESPHVKRVAIGIYHTWSIKSETMCTLTSPHKDSKKSFISACNIFLSILVQYIVRAHISRSSSVCHNWLVSMSNGRASKSVSLHHTESKLANPNNGWVFCANSTLPLTRDAKQRFCQYLCGITPNTCCLIQSCASGKSNEAKFLIK